MTINGNRLTPDDGKCLTNGAVYSQQVYLGAHDCADNWTEVDIPAEESTEAELTETEEKAQAYDILMGVSE